MEGRYGDCRPGRAGGDSTVMGSPPAPKPTCVFAGIDVILFDNEIVLLVKRLHNPTHSLIQAGMSQWARSCVHMFPVEGPSLFSLPALS